MSRIRIRTRKSWSARAPKCRTAQNPRGVHTLYLHYPASADPLGHLNTDSEQEAWLRGIQNFHMDTRGWCDIAYSYAVFQDGTVYRLRGIRAVPSAQVNANSGTVAVLCVVGNSEKPTEKLFESLKRLKNDHLDRVSGKDLPAKGHGQGPGQATECPGPHVRALIPKLNRTA